MLPVNDWENGKKIYAYEWLLPTPFVVQNYVKFVQKYVTQDFKETRLLL